MSPNTISIVVPVHNEAEHLATMIPTMAEEVAGFVGTQELLIVENGSTDATRSLARQVCGDLSSKGWKARVLESEVADYGAAMRLGFGNASGDWIVNFDIDYYSGQFVRDAVGEAADIVIASKRAQGSADLRSPFRRAATAVFNMILRYVLASGVSDTHGIKAFRREVVQRHLSETRSNQDLFDTELILRAERAGAVIVELPVVVEEKRAARSLLKRVPRTLRGVIRLRRMFDSERI